MDFTTLPTTQSAVIYGRAEAFKMFQRFEHDGWACQLSSMGQGCVSYTLIVVDIPINIFTWVFESEGVQADIA